MLEFYKGKRVFVTGHTGFKGAWLCRILELADAKLYGFSLAPPTNPSLFEIANIGSKMCSEIGDIRNYQALKSAFDKAKPEIVFHLAAQPLVREGYQNPAYTYETNVMGTVNILECIRSSSFVKSFLNVTTDKVYLNKEWNWSYRENEELDGYDPYSNSKSCSELVTHSYAKSFFAGSKTAVSTARAGNVIGGGDFASDRIIPDCVRAMERKTKIIVRNPHSVRPYQHVLEPIFAYLMIAEKQCFNKDLSGWYNVGPDECDCITTGELAGLFCEYWDGASWINVEEESAPHEANFLKLDCSKIKSTFGWKPRWHISEAVEKTVEWSKAYLNKSNVTAVMDKQIWEYIK